MQSTVEQALEWLERVKDHQVTVVGEDIIDQYIYVHAAGKSTKDNIVTFVGDTAAMWPGGARIVHRHLLELGCASVLATTFRPIIKTRYVDMVFIEKVFSVCNTADAGQLQQIIGEPTHLLCADFGHTQSHVAPSKNCFVSLMVQSNSLNWGFNLLTKYQRADYIVCDEAELRLACHDNWNFIETLVKDLGDRMKPLFVAVTLGHKGAIIYDRHDGSLRSFPPYARKVVDRMGAGDAFLAASAPLAAMGAPAEVIGLVGSMAAGLHVEKEGNPPLCREELVERLKELA